MANAAWNDNLPDPMPSGGFGRAPGQLRTRDVGAAVTAAGAIRTQIAGGFLSTLAMHSAMTPIEHSFRKLPSSGIFSATPQRPVNLFLGNFAVPKNQLLFLLDWRFDIYRPSGITVGDVVPVQESSWALSIGWDLQFSGKRQGDYEYQITPDASQPGEILPRQGPAPDAAFDRMRALNTQMPGGAGAAMLPQRHRRDVQPAMPFTYIITQDQVVTLRMIAIQPVTMPIAFFEGQFSGLLVPSETYIQFLSGQSATASILETP